MSTHVAWAHDLRCLLRVEEEDWDATWCVLHEIVVHSSLPCTWCHVMICHLSDKAISLYLSANCMVNMYYKTLSEMKQQTLVKSIRQRSWMFSESWLPTHDLHLSFGNCIGNSVSWSFLSKCDMLIKRGTWFIQKFLNECEWLRSSQEHKWGHPVYVIVFFWSIEIWTNLTSSNPSTWDGHRFVRNISNAMYPPDQVAIDMYV